MMYELQAGFHRCLPRVLAVAVATVAAVLPGCGASADQSLAEPGLHDDRTIVFSDVTHSAGLGAFRHINGARGDKWLPETMGSGAGFIDYDSDGWQDVLVVGGGIWADPQNADPIALRLFRNRGDGTFEDRTQESGLSAFNDYGMGVTVADFDNDGDDDFYFTTIYQNRLLQNNQGRFNDVAGTAGVAGDPIWSTAAVFFDANRDGHPDLFVGNYVRWSPETDLWCSTDGQRKMYCAPQGYEGLEGRFYLSRGDGTFEDATLSSGLVSAGKTLGAVTLDFDANGHTDLLVANDTNPDQLFKNMGDGTFREIGVASGVAFDEHGQARAGMGVDAGPVAYDDEVTIFVGNFSDEMIGVYSYVRNDVFVDRSAATKIGRSSLKSLTFGLFLFDADLDGDLDLFAANGHIDEDIEKVRDNTTFRQRAHLFLNDGSGTFDDAAGADRTVLGKPIVGRGAAYADYDRDGDVDVLVTENAGPLHLWRNDTKPAGNFLRVRLEGTTSGRDGIDGVVRIWNDGTKVDRTVRAGRSYLSSPERVLTFGLGASTYVDSVVVGWPSGIVDVLVGVSAGEQLTIVEGRYARSAVQAESAIGVHRTRQFGD